MTSKHVPEGFEDDRIDKLMDAGCIAVLGCAISLPLLAIGGGWLYTFLLTSYRSHLAIQGVAAGIAAMSAGLIVGLFAIVLVYRRVKGGD